MLATISRSLWLWESDICHARTSGWMSSQACFRLW